MENLILPTVIAVGRYAICLSLCGHLNVKRKRQS